MVLLFVTEPGWIFLRQVLFRLLRPQGGPMGQNRSHYACGAEHNRRWSGWGMAGTARIHCLAISRGLLFIEVLLLDPEEGPHT